MTKWKRLEEGSSPGLPPGRWLTPAEVEEVASLESVLASLDTRRAALEAQIASLESEYAERLSELRENAREQMVRDNALLLRSLNELRRRWKRVLVEAAVQGVSEVFRTLWRDFSERSPETLPDMISDAIGSVEPDERLVLRVPSARRDAVAGALGHGAAVRVAPDPRLADSDAVLEVPDGQFDIRLDALLADLKPALEKTLMVALDAVDTHMSGAAEPAAGPDEEGGDAD